MKNLILMLILCASLTSCSSIKKTYVKDYNEKIELTRRKFPELYELYRQGALVIDAVYTFERDGEPRVGITYHYR